MRPIVTHALEFGLVLSAVLFGLLLVVLRANPEIMLNDYPPDIRARWGPMSERTKRQRVFVAVAFLAVILGVVAWSFESFPAVVSRDGNTAAVGRVSVDGQRGERRQRGSPEKWNKLAPSHSTLAYTYSSRLEVGAATPTMSASGQ